MNKTKIALYTTTFPPKLGGIATSNYNIYNLLKNHYDVKLFVYNEKITKTNKTHIVYAPSKKSIKSLISFLFGIYLKRYDKNEKFKTTKSIMRFAVSVFSLNKALKQFNPDIIFIADNGVPAYAIKKPKNTKLVWFTRNNYNRFKNQVLCPTIPSVDLDIACSMERNAFKKVDVVVSPSKYMIKVTQDTLNDKTPIYVINNIILRDIIYDIPKECLYEKLNIDRTYHIIYIPSAGSSIKGKRYVYEIIRQLIKHTNNQIAFYLSGPIPADLKFELSLIKEANIYAPGHVNWEENIALMKTCTICVTPNIIENYSNAMLEAQTVNIPIVAFDTGGNKEIVKNNYTGYIVPHLDIDALIQKSKDLISNEKTYSQFKANCSTHIDTIANQDNILNDYKKLINMITNS